MKWLIGTMVLASVGLTSAALAVGGASLVEGSQSVTAGANSTVLLSLDVEGVGEPGTVLDILTENLDPPTPMDSADTELGLYDPNGQLILANDDMDSGLSSRLTFDDGDVLLPGRYTVVYGSFDTIFPDEDPTAASSDGPGVTSDIVVTLGDAPACVWGPSLCDRSAAAYTTINALDAGRIASGGASRFDPDVIDAQLANARRRISNGGCTQNAYTELGFEFVAGGLYNKAGVVTGGTSEGATITAGSLDRGTRSFSTTFDNGSVIGGLSSAFNKNRQIVADLDANGYFAAQWIRIRGTRGVWVGIGGACEAPNLTPLANWYRGSFDTLELVD